MKHFVHLFVLVCFLFAGQSRAQQKTLTVEDIFKSQKFALKSLSGITWLPDETAFLFWKHEDQNSQLIRHDVKSGHETEWLNLAAIKDPKTEQPIKLFSYSLSKDAQKMVLKVDARRVWRRFDEARFLVYNLKNQRLTPVYNDSLRVRHAKLSPDGNFIGFVFDNNLFVQNLQNGNITQITFDGSADIINGQFDWVYEEEFGQSDGWRWSPDSKKIAFWRVDQSREPTFSWTEFEGKYGKVRTIHYPKAGDTNATVKIGVFNLTTKQTVWMNIGETADFYIPRIKWTNNPNIMAIMRLNRLQNQLQLLFADVNSGRTRPVLTETDSCWVDVRDDLYFLKKKDQFLWTSERSGFRHLYLYDYEGHLVKQLTHGNWEVTAVYGVDEARQQVYFTANKDNPLENHLFSIGLDGRNLRTLDVEAGVHYPLFSPHFKYFIDRYSSASQPLILSLKKSTGEVICTLIKNKRTQFEGVQLALPEFLTFKTSDGVTLYARMIKPVDFDSTKKYPVLIYGYGGPGSQLVRNEWVWNMLWYTLLTQNGYLIFTVDNRGTGGRGKAFKNLAYGDIGKYAFKDHVEAVKFLSTLPYVDAKRIGIWGWSGGGYLTLMCLTKGAKYFKAGIAVAPVVDFRLYDTIWTERYMGLPQQNAAGYDSTSVLSYVDGYQSGLLIVHGSSDDNVHMQNTMQIIKRFQELGKQFQLMIYPELNHSLQGPGARYHLFKMMTNFILQNL